MLPEKITLAIVDDHPIVVEGLKLLLLDKPHIDMVGSFHTGESFLKFLNGVIVDIVLLDITLPDKNGLDLCKEIKQKHPETNIIILSNHSERSIIMQALQHGASGYLLKNASANELMDCLNTAIRGQVALSEEVKGIMARPSTIMPQGFPTLTAREKEILPLIAEGLTTADIGHKLFISPLTIETHRRNLMQKFGAKNVAELIKLATLHGLT
ncbi:response regulator transcription factor [Pedobacter sp. ASV12]|uniref:response regulator transcription factor n=1 Tax=Pedobacter sp. ASV12 TaxID=2795120 RepID=UPI0018EC007A|nr:response regulator transcription factor [Pedobacter sp. ASV12]